MRRALRRLAWTAAAIGAAACATGGAGGTGGGAHGTSDAPGEQLYRAKCALCHRLHAPESRTRAEWATQVARMAPRAHLSDDERARVLDYVQAHAKDVP